MYAFTESIEIGASPAVVWDVLHDLEGWWPASNPEHESLERLDDRGIEPGARIRIREKVAGIPGVATGEITAVEPRVAVTWEAPEARYRLFGVRVTVGEGVTWRITPRDAGCSVSAHVWATFPSGVVGRVLEWGFTYVWNGVAKDREHARVELRYLKKIIENR